MRLPFVMIWNEKPLFFLYILLLGLVGGLSVGAARALGLPAVLGGVVGVVGFLLLSCLVIVAVIAVQELRKGDEPPPIAEHTEEFVQGWWAIHTPAQDEGAPEVRPEDIQSLMECLSFYTRIIPLNEDTIEELKSGVTRALTDLGATAEWRAAALEALSQELAD